MFIMLLASGPLPAEVLFGSTVGCDCGPFSSERAPVLVPSFSAALPGVPEAVLYSD